MTATDVVRDADPTATAPGTAARASALGAVAAVVLALLTIPGGAGLLPPGAIATVASGEAEVLSGDAWRTLAVGGVMREGEVVRTRGSRAELTTADGTLRMAGDTRLRLDAGRVRVERGSVLFEDTARWGASVGLVTVDGEGTWRVDAAAAPRVAAYAGDLTVSDGSTRLDVAGLWQAPLVAAGLATDIEPLRYVAADPWDRRFLAEAIATDRFLAGLANSLTLRYGDAPQDPDFYADFGVVEGDMRTTLVALALRRDGERVGPPASVLTGALLVDLVARRGELRREQATEQVVDLRRQGAAWGLVAVSFGLTAADVRAAADGALEGRAEAEDRGSATAVVAGPSAAPGDAAPVTADAPGQAATDGAPGSEGSNPGGPGGEPGGDDDGGEPGSDEDPVGEVDDAVDEVSELLPDPEDAPPDPDDTPPDPDDTPPDPDDTPPDPEATPPEPEATPPDPQHLAPDPGDGPGRGDDPGQDDGPIHDLVDDLGDLLSS